MLPKPGEQLNPFAYTQHKKNGTIGQGKVGEADKMLKTIYNKSLLGVIFVQTCSLTSIYNGMYKVFSYDTPQ